MFELKYSKGNMKLGVIASVSLPPVVTCAEGVPCTKDCYANKYCKYRSSCGKAYASNLELYKNNPDKYFADLEALLIVNSLFRMHVAGDIPDTTYLDRLNKICKRHKNCKVLCYTKKFDLVNTYYEKHTISPNLIVVFSEWLNVLKAPNPNNLPVARTIIKKEDANVNEFICTNHCDQCNYRCWKLKRGERVAFVMH